MRKITLESTNAFLNARTFNKENMAVKVNDLTTELYLHGNMIARKCANKLFIQNCGWFSNTTKERLNALPGVSISQKAGQWFLNGILWDGKLIEVK